MNERIKQLAERNGFVHEWQSPGEQRDILKNLERFAELIVKECIQICSNVEADTEMNLSDGALVCMAEIKEHFGVKE